MTKVIVIALDGATLDLLQPWMDQGELPLLARLFAEGAGGTLNSTIPWATPTAFASFATGTNPGKHGVYDFGELIGDDYSAFVPTSGAHVHGKTLWQRLTDVGLSSLVVNMPMTWPAPVINGHIVSGIPYPSGSRQACYPPGLLDELRVQGLDIGRNASDDLGGSYADYFNGLLDLTRTRATATATLIKQHNPDFVAVHFLETDQAQHRFWQFMPGEPRHDPNGEHTDAILRLFKATETAMQQILDAAPEATLCVMSDHGFGPTRQQVWLNNWLLQNDWLTLKDNPGVSLKRLLYKIGLYPANIREKAPERLKLAILQFFERQKGRALASSVEKSTQTEQKGIADKLTERLAIDFYDVDWSRTRAFSTGTTAVGYVYLNRAGRDPQGIVSQLDYAKERALLADDLRKWDVVGDVLTCEEVWDGAQLANAPDLVVRWKDPATDARYFQTRFSSPHLAKPVPNDYASHRPNGLFLFHGNDVQPGSVDGELVDLTATLLWLLDQPVPTYMDGRVLRECFMLERDVEIVEEEIEDVAGDGISAEDEAAIRDSLRALGYLD